MNLVELHGHSDTYVDVLVKDVEAFRTAISRTVAGVEHIGDVEERAIVRVTMNQAVTEEGLDVETIVENMNYFLFMGVDAFRALSQLSNVLQDLHAPYEIREVETPREEENEERGVYIYIEPVHPLIEIMLEGFFMAMEDNGVTVRQGTATAVTVDGDEVDHIFVFFPEYMGA